LDMESAMGGGAHGPAPVEGKKKLAAIVEVGVSLASLRSVQQDLWMRGGGIIALVALLGLVSALLIASLLIRPLNQVAAASEAIAAGDLTVRLRTKRAGDEINKLAAFFNRMAEVLDRQRQEVTGLTAELTRQRDSERALRDIVVMSNAAPSVKGLVDGLFTRL